MGSDECKTLSEQVNPCIVMVSVTKLKIAFQWVNFQLTVFIYLSGLFVVGKVVAFCCIFAKIYQKAYVKMPSCYLKSLGGIKFVKEKMFCTKVLLIVFQKDFSCPC